MHRIRRPINKTHVDPRDPFIVVYRRRSADTWKALESHQSELRAQRSINNLRLQDSTALLKILHRDTIRYIGRIP